MGSGIHRIRLLSTGCSTAVTCSFFVILPSCALRFFFLFSHVLKKVEFFLFCGSRRVGGGEGRRADESRENVGLISQ